MNQFCVFNSTKIGFFVPCEQHEVAGVHEEGPVEVVGADSTVPAYYQCLMKSNFVLKQSPTICLVAPGKDVDTAAKHHLEQLQGGDNHGQHLRDGYPAAVHDNVYF